MIIEVGPETKGVGDDVLWIVAASEKNPEFLGEKRRHIATLLQDFLSSFFVDAIATNTQFFFVWKIVALVILTRRFAPESPQ